jgi:diguanylate cyclase (GGDEF)-like protein/PAS domain S-box-containing protein
VPALTVLLVFTNEWHHLIWTSYTPNPLTEAFLIYGHGPWFWLCAGYSLLAGLSGWLVLVWSTIRSPRLYQRQIGILLASIIIPVLGSFIYMTGRSPVAGLDPAALAFALSALTLAGGMFGFGLHNLVAAARHQLIENMSDSLLVLDVRNRIVNINRAARDLLARPGQPALGQPVDSLLGAWSDLLSQCKEAQEGRAEIRLEGEKPRYLEVHISPVYDRLRRLTGKLIVLHDITERRQIQELLVQHVEELGIVSHINQAITSGLDLAEVLKTLREQCALVAAFDVFYVGLYDPETGLVQIPTFYGFGKYRTGPSRDLRQHPGHLGQVIEKRRTMYLPNIEPGSSGEPPTIQVDGAGSARSYLGIPLVLRDRPIGAICFLSSRPEAFAEEEIRLLESIAIQAAIAISNAQLYAEVQRLAIIDELTGLYNYRGLMALGAREVERARRFDHPLCVLFLDIDGFRAFNNRYGHLTGNEVLQQVARCCLANMRTVDLVARYGGDEFVILLPETELAAGREVALRLSRAAAEMPILTRHGGLSVTLSIGLASLLPETKDLAALVDRANQAERLAKQQGAGRTVIMEGSG